MKHSFFEDIAYNKKFFETLINRYGYHVKALGWNEKSQKERFDILIQVDDIKGKSLLDVGCAFGDLVGYLKKKEIQATYHGVDISSRMIEIARELNPEHNFEVSDILCWPDQEKYDYVVSNGFGNIKTTNNNAMMEAMITKMFSMCKKAVAVTMTSASSQRLNPDTFYYEPERIVSIARKLSQRFLLRHDYMPHDLTIYIYKGY